MGVAHPSGKDARYLLGVGRRQGWKSVGARVCPDSAPKRLNIMRTASIASAMPDFVARQDNSDERSRFDRLIEPHLGEAFALALALSSDRGAAQDAVQNAAFKAWRQMPQM